MGGLMEIPMDDVKEIKEGMHKLDIEYAKMSMVLIGIEKTQSQMVEIMDNQSRQKEKNKGFDSSIHRLNNESLDHAKAIAANEKTIAAVVAKYASAASFLVVAAGIAYELLKSAPAG